MAKDTDNNSYTDMVKFYNKKEREPVGGKFFTVHHHKAPSEHGVWARSKQELIQHFNKIRKHFISIEAQI